MAPPPALAGAERHGEMGVLAILLARRRLRAVHAQRELRLRGNEAGHALDRALRDRHARFAVRQLGVHAARRIEDQQDRTIGGVAGLGPSGRSEQEYCQSQNRRAFHPVLHREISIAATSIRQGTAPRRPWLRPWMRSKIGRCRLTHLSEAVRSRTVLRFSCRHFGRIPDRKEHAMLMKKATIAVAVLATTLLALASVQAAAEPRRGGGMAAGTKAAADRACSPGGPEPQPRARSTRRKRLPRRRSPTVPTARRRMGRVGCGADTQSVCDRDAQRAAPIDARRCE